MRVARLLVLATLGCLCAAFGAAASAQDDGGSVPRRRPASFSHRHILTGQFPVPDWVRDPHMRKLLDDALRQQGARPWSEMTPQQRDLLLRQLRDFLGKVPTDGNPLSPDSLRDLQGFEDLLESFRKLQEAQGAPGGSDLGRTFSDWVRDLTRDLDGWKGMDKAFADGAGDAPPLLSPKGAEMMRKWIGDVRITPEMKKELNRGLAGLRDTFKGMRDWFKDVRGPETGPRNPDTPKGWQPVQPDPPPGGGGGTGPTGGTAGPTLPESFRFPAREFLTALLWCAGIGLALYGALLVYRTLGPLGARAIAGRRLRRPRLPPAFDGPEAFFRLYGELMAYVCRRPSAGRTHRELERLAAAAHPEAGAGARDVTEVYESLYYDRRTHPRAGELCARAHALCLDLLERIAT